MKDMTNILIFGLAMLILGFSIGSFIFKPKKEEFKRLKSNQEYRDSTYLSKQGGSSLYHPPKWDVKKDGKFFNYRLNSWDGGKNWYVVDYNFDTKEFKILGEVNELYPGLLKHVIGMDNLLKYAEENGPIDGTDPRGIEVLEDVGFTVEKKTNK